MTMLFFDVKKEFIISMIKQINIIFTLLLMIGGLLGCQSTAEEGEIILPTSSSSSGSESASADDGYPIDENGYPITTAVTPQRLEVDFEVQVTNPAADKSAITGQVISERTNAPIPGLPIFLAMVFENDAYVLNPAVDPYTTTDKNGRYFFDSIEPGNYLLVVGNVEVGDYAILSENDAGTVLNAAPNQILEVEPFTVLLNAWE